MLQVTGWVLNAFNVLTSVGTHYHINTHKQGGHGDDKCAGKTNPFVKHYADYWCKNTPDACENQMHRLVVGRFFTGAEIGRANIPEQSHHGIKDTEQDDKENQKIINPEIP